MKNCIALLALMVSIPAFASPRAGFECQPDFVVVGAPISVSYLDLGFFLVLLEGNFEAFTGALRSSGVALPVGHIQTIRARFESGCYPATDGLELAGLRVGCLGTPTVDVTVLADDGHATVTTLHPKFAIFRTAIQDVLSWSGPRHRYLVSELELGDASGRTALLHGETLEPEQSCESF